MLEVEYFYDAEYDRWNGVCVDDRDINCTWYTKAQMIESLVNGWNAKYATAFTEEDVHLTEAQWRHDG